MRAILQRVKHAHVSVDGQIIGQIDRGLTILVAIAPTDTVAELEWMTRKCLDLRLFPPPEDPEGRWEKSVVEIGGELLIVSQFTLYGDCRKGRRPSFSGSAPPSIAEALYEQWTNMLRDRGGIKVETGCFGANMQVQIDNDGPVTLILEREAETVSS